MTNPTINLAHIFERNLRIQMDQWATRPDTIEALRQNQDPETFVWNLECACRRAAYDATVAAAARAYHTEDLLKLRALLRRGHVHYDRLLHTAYVSTRKEEDAYFKARHALENARSLAAMDPSEVDRVDSAEREVDYCGAQRWGFSLGWRLGTTA